MTTLTTTASLVELSTLDEESQVTTTLERSELEALLAAGTSHQLWFEVGVEGEAESQRLTLELTDDDLRALLERSPGDEIQIAVDGEGIAELLEEPEVEAHGMRAALAVAVATAAIAAPSGLAATQQSVGTASVGTAATTQAVGAAATSQRAGAAATTQVSSQVVRSQVARSAGKSQRVSPVKFRSLTIIRSGVVR